MNIDNEAKRAAEKCRWTREPGFEDLDLKENTKIIEAEFADVIAERDRLAKQVERLTRLAASAAEDLSGSCLADEINAALQEQPDPKPPRRERQSMFHNPMDHE